MDHSYGYGRRASSRPLNASVQQQYDAHRYSAPTSFHGMITAPVMVHLRDLEMRHFESPLYRETTQVFYSDIRFHSILGRGKFSTVYKVQLPSSGDNNADADADDYVALKVLNPAQIHQHVQAAKGSTTTAKLVASAAEEIYREATILAKHHHPNIINLRGVAVEGLVGSFSSTENHGYFVVLEMIQETLEQRIPKWQQYQRPRLWPTRRLSAKSSSSSSSSLMGGGDPEESRGDLPERIAVATAIASAVAYLHKQHIVVRDLCPESIGFDSRNRVKLFDFGLARSPQECILDIQLDGNFRYMAPEIMICQSSGYPGDVYSFGVLLWELMTLQRPYEAFFTHKPGSDKPIFCQSKFTNEVILNKQWRPSCSTIADPETRRLIQECWCADPEARPNAEQVVWRLEQSITPGQRRRRSSYSQPQRRSSLIPIFSKGGPQSSQSSGLGSDMQLAAAAVAADPSLFLDGYDSDDSAKADPTIAEVPNAKVTTAAVDNGDLSFSELINLCLVDEPAPVLTRPKNRRPGRSQSMKDDRPRLRSSKSDRPSSMMSLKKIQEKTKETDTGLNISCIPGAFSSNMLPDQDMIDDKKISTHASRDSRGKVKEKKGVFSFSKKSSKNNDHQLATPADFGLQYGYDNSF